MKKLLFRTMLIPIFIYLFIFCVIGLISNIFNNFNKIVYMKKLLYTILLIFILTGCSNHNLEVGKNINKFKKLEIGNEEELKIKPNKTIEFTDDNTGEDFIIKSDNKDYVGFGGNSIMYFSVTNISENNQIANIVYSLGENINIVSTERFLRNDIVEKEIIIPSSATSSEQIIIEKKEIEIFEEVGLESPKIKKETIRKTIDDRISKNGFSDYFKAGETKYYKARINIPVGTNNDEFFIEAFGEESYGHLDPTAWSYEQLFNALNTGTLAGQDSWTISTGTWNVATDQTYEGAKSLKVNGTTSALAYRSVTSFDSGSVFIAMRKDGGQYGEFSPGAWDAPPWKIGWLGSTSNLTIRDASEATTETIYTGTSDNAWYVIEIEFQVNTYMEARARVYDGSSWGSFSSWIVGDGDVSSLSQFRLRVQDANNYWYDTITPTNPIDEDTCTYGGSGDWDILYSDNCYITSDVYVDGELNVIASSTGSLGIENVISATKHNIGNSEVLKIDCKVGINCLSGRY